MAVSAALHSMPAVFLDKDGTLLDNVPFNVDPERITLAPGAAEGTRLLTEAGYALVIVTNQGGIARGIFPEPAMLPVEMRVRALVEAAGGRLLGFYYCPHDVRGSVVPFNRACGCRKPEPGLLQRAARELGLALEQAWLVGDILDDVEAGRRAGCRTILLDCGNETEWRLAPSRLPHRIAHDLREAAEIILTDRAGCAAEGCQALGLRTGGSRTGGSRMGGSRMGGSRTDGPHTDGSHTNGVHGGALEPHERHETWRAVRRVLAVRLDALGDVLMTTPALHAIKASVPDAKLTLLTSPGGAEAARLSPDVDDVIVYEAPWMKATAARASSAPDFALIERLRAAVFDAAVIFTVYSQNPLPAALLCFLADIPQRLAHCRENPYGLLTRWIPECEPDVCIRHEARRQLDLVAAVGWHTTDDRLRLEIPPDAAARVETLLAEAGIDTARPWLVVHPGASAPSRRYPAARFAAVIRTLATEHGRQVVLTGACAEAPLVESIREQAQISAVSLAGRLDLGELAALLARAPVLLSNNTGPVHAAAAVGTPVVDLYALTNPQHTPWRVPCRVLFEDVPCRCCYKSVCPTGHHACLLGVPPKRVVAAVLELTESAVRLEASAAPLPGPPHAALGETRASVVAGASPAALAGAER